MSSIYDQYRLQNSTVVPMFAGTTAPEALQVAQHLQGLYDAAKSGGNELESATGNLQSLIQDKGLKDEVIGKITGDLKKISASGDWENQVEPVRALGRYYAQRSAELVAPIKQYQEWRKTLDDKERNLTTSQKNIYEAMAMAEYKGLRKNNMGQFEGNFNGPRLAKNIDVPKKVDEWMNKAAIQMGGSEAVNDNGFWKVKHGNKWETLSEDTVRKVLSNAIGLDEEYQDYKNMQGTQAGFYGQYAKTLDDVPAYAKSQVEAAMKEGISLSDATATILENTESNGIDRMAENYALAKYKVNRSWSENESSMGDIEKSRLIKEQDIDRTTEVVADYLDNPATKYEDIKKDTKTYTGQKEEARREIEVAKNLTGRDYEAKNGKGSWEKLDGAMQEKALADFYDKQPGGTTLYANLQKARSNYKAADNNLRQLKEVDQAIENFVLQKQYGITREEAIQNMTNNLTKAIGTGNIKVIENGVPREFTAQQFKDKIKGSSFENGNELFGGIDDLRFKSISGSEIVIMDRNNTTEINSVINDASKRYQGFAKAKEKYTTEALQNYSQSTGLVITNNKPTNEMMHRTIQGAEKVLYDASGNKVDDKDVMALIEAGDFEYLGAYTENKGNQNSMMKISVRDKNNKDATPTSYRIGLKGTTQRTLGQRLIRESVNKDGSIKDPDTYAAGLAMMPGSAYNKINRSKYGVVATVQELQVVNGKPEYVTVYEVEKGRVSGIPSIAVKNKATKQLATDSNGNPLDNQLDISASLYEFESNPKYKVVYHD